MAIPLSRRLDFSEIPVIDVGRLVAGDDDPATIAAIGTACTDIGFLYVQNHGVDQALIDELQVQSRRFFARPLEERMSIVLDPQMRGYLPLDYQSLIGEKGGGGVSHQEGFWIGHERPLNTASRLDGYNQWLAGQPELEAVMSDYFVAVEALSAVLERSFALALGLAPTFFQRFFTAPLTRLKLNHYPPQHSPDRDDHIGVVSHADTGAFTILWQDDNGGLEIQTKSGDWVGAPPIPGTFVINLGVVMQVWTNGRFSATPHRVINRSGIDRYSVPLFVNPNQDAPFTPLMGEPDPESADAQYGDYQRDIWRRIFPVAGIPA